MGYDYPGNIRELENIIEHAFVLTHGTVINIDDLPDSVRPEDRRPVVAPSSSLGDLEAVYITETLKKNNWNRLQTARELGMHKTTLWRKMKKLGIEPPDIK